ncbi:ferredoxin [Haloglomus salinum]|uniref:ferredoxin n=1 Tax=Haloglomus salinum TaxID=2962673 RepID=UPI0020C9C2CF|nr:ferredoxin [Haloglomus salinum]
MSERYRVTVDKEACDGIFACLVRDDRLVEADDGLAGFDPDEAVAVEQTADSVTATFEDDRRDEAESAARACPPNAISVEVLE